MASVNKVILIGNLGRDPETRYMPDGGAVTNVSIATTESWKDKNGEKQEKTEWHRVAFFGKLAEIAASTSRRSASLLRGSAADAQVAGQGRQDKYTTESSPTDAMLGSRQWMVGGDREREPAASAKAPPVPPASRGGHARRSKFDDIETTFRSSAASMPGPPCCQ